MANCEMASNTQIATALALCIASLSVGYALGSHTALDVNAVVPPHVHQEYEEEDIEDEDVADGDLSVVQAGFTEQCKLVLVVRTDLKMGHGKIAAQCGHATIACYKALFKKNPKLVKHWERTGQAKIALKAKSEDQLLELEAIARSLNLCARPIKDAGLTEVESGTTTVLGIGPAPISLINEVTGKLRLL